MRVPPEVLAAGKQQIRLGQVHPRQFALPPAAAAAYGAVLAGVRARELRAVGGTNTGPWGALDAFARRFSPSVSAARHAMTILAAQDPAFAPRSVLEYGGVGGAGLLAAELQWGRLASLERSREIASINRLTGCWADPAVLALANEFWNALLPNETPTEITLAPLLPPETAGFDLVVSTNALADGRRGEATAERLWEQTRDALILVDDRGEDGFRRIAAARAHLLSIARSQQLKASGNPSEGWSALAARGARVAAPCPHDGVCAMAAPGGAGALRPAICRFSTRAVQPEFARQISGNRSSSGYEQVCFSFVVLRRGERLAGNDAWPRLIAPSLKRRGHQLLDWCQPDGALARVRVDRPTGDARLSANSRLASYAARKARWGDSVPSWVTSDLANVHVSPRASLSNVLETPTNEPLPRRKKGDLEERVVRRKRPLGRLFGRQGSEMLQKKGLLTNAQFETNEARELPQRPLE